MDYPAARADRYLFVIPACPESFRKDSRHGESHEETRHALLAGMTTKETLTTMRALRNSWTKILLGSSLKM